MQQSTVTTLQGQDVPQTSAQLPATAGTTSNNPPMPNSTPTAQYDGNGNAIQGGVTSPPANTGAALAGAITGMVQDVAARSKQSNNAYSDVPVPGTPTTTTETVVIQQQDPKHSAILLWGTVICVAAAGVTLYQAHVAGKHHHGK